MQNSNYLDKEMNIKCHSVYIGKGVRGFVYKSKKGKYHIFVSDTLSQSSASRVIAHEMYHIKHDMPIKPYIIGLDCENEDFENKAKKFEVNFASIVALLMRSE